MIWRKSGRARVRLYLGRRSVARSYVELPEQRRQPDLDLQEREPAPHAHPRPLAESHEGHGLPGGLRLLGEPLGLEPVRVRVVPLVHVDPDGRDVHNRPPGQRQVRPREPVLSVRLPGENP